jgi:hypothetical protein
VWDTAKAKPGASLCRLAKLGFNGTEPNMKLKLTFKSENLVKILIPSLKKKAYFACVKSEWELQAIMGA